MLTTKPQVKITGQNGNTLNLVAICSRVLKKNGMHKEAEELSSKVFECKSQDEAIQLMSKYCDLY